MSNKNQIIVIGDLQPQSKFGAAIRQQNQVIYIEGISPAMTAEHARHEFKIIILYTL